MALKKGTEIPTIDVNLVTITTLGETPTEVAIDTSNKIGVEPQIETTESVKLIIKNKLKAQKPEESTLTGNLITLTDNVFTPELVKTLQGGEILYDETDSSKIIGYTPPAPGSGETGETFILSAYSAQYNEAGEIVQYEKITYPNCKGTPVSLSSEDGVFRVTEYAINSTPLATEPPYRIDYEKELPTVS